MGFYLWRKQEMNLKDLEVLRLEMIEAKKKFDTNAVLYAQNNCGYVIGDVVEITGFSHRGKNMKITSFSLKYDNWKRKYIAVVHGVVLKNNGDESKNTAINEIVLT